MHTETRPSLVVKHALNSLPDLFTSIRVISESGDEVTLSLSLSDLEVLCSALSAHPEIHHEAIRARLDASSAEAELARLEAELAQLKTAARLVVRCLESGSLAGSAGNEALLNLSSLVQGPAR